MPGPPPLAHIRVVDLTRARSGPTAVRQLADMGAQVVRVEAREATEGDSTALGFDFLNLHRNKRALTLDLKHPRGLEVLRRLAAQADVVVENFRPDVKRRLGIDYEALAALNPRLVYGSISGFGQTGPYAERPGYDQIAQGMGGLMSITGLPGQGPVRVGIPVADLAAGLYLAQGILVALLERERSGRGQWVHTSLLQAMVTMLDFQAARWLIDGEIPPQAGNDHPTGIPTGVFTTADGHINVAASGQAMYRRLCAAIGAPELVDDPRFRTLADRSTHRAAMNAALDRVFATKPSAEWIEALNRAGVPSGPILDVREVFEDPQVRHLGLAQPVRHPTHGEIQVQGLPTALSRTPGAVRLPAPGHGEHTDAILAELGYTPAEIAELRRVGAV
ncbi:MAG: formyl-CoA transferase [Candidatus Rokubacteria bacterium RIFCSPHIGHO2_12_FULL_73_22]|nr:MAG: formyl-CoA transferase [Candidatus Rokubacteria bacterium RIFCSPHIGHO2_02_FULL_73_26]OGL04751.1 MAG: formyl-CoA transferase [Candidatus Rokubacteria bacterium RIFCSPHIGHO2_12_FULL_73_22]OGL10987.1 MAG: formyl-CoA transferase [Candidatus Rokubacteria bacterium RIFCSPLOWO2_02_FULL_73_56]